MRDYLFPPLFFPLFIFIILLPFLAVLFVFGASSAISEVLELSVKDGIVILFLVIIGSFINIPLFEKEGRLIERRYSLLGFMYTVRRRSKIVIAINLGGCVIPVLISLKILFSVTSDAFAIAFILTSFVTFISARPVPGVGITVPMLVPPLASALFSYLAVLAASAPAFEIPRIAFTAGVLGVLFGADILHLRDIEKIGSGVVSIGGAGTFDGIFLTGIFSVFIAQWFV